MNEVMNAILTRRSIRKFTGVPVPEHVLNDIIKAALLDEIGVPADHVIYGIAALGYPDPTVPVEPKERTGKVVYVK